MGKTKKGRELVNSIRRRTNIIESVNNDDYDMLLEYQKFIIDSNIYNVSSFGEFVDKIIEVSTKSNIKVRKVSYMGKLYYIGPNFTLLGKNVIYAYIDMEFKINKKYVNTKLCKLIEDNIKEYIVTKDVPCLYFVKKETLTKEQERRLFKLNGINE